ncbi:guanine nucleotide exchange factor DBS isoform X2 [Tachysurus ichikawai]
MALYHRFVHMRVCPYRLCVPIIFYFFVHSYARLLYQRLRSNRLHYALLSSSLFIPPSSPSSSHGWRMAMVWVNAKEEVVQELLRRLSSVAHNIDRHS